MSGERPPWTHITLPSIIAPIPNVSKHVTQCLQTDAFPYLLASASRQVRKINEQRRNFRQPEGRGVRGDAPIYLVEETIDLSYLSTLMISSQQRDVPWKLELQAEQQTQSFDRIMPSIDEVP